MNSKILFLLLSGVIIATGYACGEETSDDAGMMQATDVSDDNDFDEPVHFVKSEYANQVDVDPQLTDFVPALESPAATGAATPPSDGFFDASATYIGAFAPGGDDWTAGWTNFDAEPTNDCPALADRETVEISGQITESATWDCTKKPVLNDLVFVNADVTLTIEKGTWILGDAGSAFIVTRGGKLITNGTADAPVVFTSINATTDNPSRAGDWGGLVLLGKAPINVEENAIEGIDPANPAVPEDGNKYGGSDETHDCGQLKYTRVEYAGFELTTDNELNGVTLGGCGTATTVDYVQVHEGLDDGIEIFGGAPNLKYVVLSNIQDDSLDWDQGFHGKIQFLVAKQSDADADNGFEADNLKANNDATPRSMPTIYNATLLGSEAGSNGMVLRRGTWGVLKNFIISGFPKSGVDVRDGATAAGADDDSLSITNSIFFSNGMAFDEN